MLRWRIALLVGVAIAISYLDRQTLPVAVSAIARDIPLTNQRFSALQSAFLLSYALMYVGGGKLVDALGTRIGFAVIMAFWSLANASHALATSFGMLMASRFLLGLGEGGGFPAATRAVAEWFAVKDRATAIVLIHAGPSVGGGWAWWVGRGAPAASGGAAGATGSPWSRRAARSAPLTTRPAVTSRQGIIRRISVVVAAAVIIAKPLSKR